MGSESWSPMEENGQSQIEEGYRDDECCGADQINEYDEDSDENDDMKLPHEKNRTLVQRRNVILIIILVTVAIPVAFLLGDNLQQDYYLVRHMSLVGAAWGAACSIVIVWSSHTVIAYNRHPNALLYWRSVCSLGTAMKIFAVEMWTLLPCLDADERLISCQETKYCHLCEREWLAAALTFFFISAEIWFALLAVDLYFSTLNPFYSFKKRLKSFHLFAWSTAALLAMIPFFEDQFSHQALKVYGFSSDSTTPSASESDKSFTTTVCNSESSGRPHRNVMNLICWYILPEADSAYSLFRTNSGIWYVWIPVLIIWFVTLAILLQVSRRLREGLANTFAARLRVFAQEAVILSVYMTWLILYLLLECSLYFSFAQRTKHAFRAYLIVSRAAIDLIAWFVVNDPQKIWVSSSKRDSSMNATNSDLDLQPQVNVTLRSEILHYITSGIRKSLNPILDSPTNDLVLSARTDDIETEAIPPASLRHISQPQEVRGGSGRTAYVGYRLRRLKLGHIKKISLKQLVCIALDERRIRSMQQTAVDHPGCFENGGGPNSTRERSPSDGSNMSDHWTHMTNDEIRESGATKWRLDTPLRASLLPEDPFQESAEEQDLDPSASSAVPPGLRHGSKSAHGKNSSMRCARTLLKRVKSCVASSNDEVAFFTFKADAFRRVREHFGLDASAYADSFANTAKERLTEGGSSGAFFFYTKCERFMVKSSSTSEFRALLDMADDYAEYVCSHSQGEQQSLLARIYGAYLLRLYETDYLFFVMENLLNVDGSEDIIQQRYDIKGSWVGRNMSPPKAGQVLTCRHCNQKYTYKGEQKLWRTIGESQPHFQHRYRAPILRSPLPPQASAWTSSEVSNNRPRPFERPKLEDNCPLRLLGRGHEPNLTLKDNDLNSKLKMDPEEAENLVAQLSRDSRMLADHGIMDYSLLIGVQNLEYHVNEVSSGDNENLGRGTLTPSQSPTSCINSSSSANLTDSPPQLRRHSSVHTVNEVVDLDRPVVVHRDSLTPTKSDQAWDVASDLRDRTVSAMSSSDVPPVRRRSSRPAQLQRCIRSSSVKSFVDEVQEVTSRTLQPVTSRKSGVHQIGDNFMLEAGRQVVQSKRESHIVTRQVYYFGVIDVLQKWTWRKRVERWWKIWILRRDPKGVSVIQPEVYRARFMEKVADSCLI